MPKKTLVILAIIFPLLVSSQSVYRWSQGGTNFAGPYASSSLIISNGTRFAPIATSSLGLPTFTDLSDYLSLSAWYGTTTDALDEGTTNLYYTTARFIADLLGGYDAIFGNSTTTNATTTNLFSTNATITTLNTTNINNSGIATTTKLCFANGECMTQPSPIGAQVTFYPHNTDSDIATYEDACGN
jgi:hypothetical protein